MKSCITTLIIMTYLYSLGECLKCFECDNKINPACGVEFKAYQYKAKPCRSQVAKCGLQRQQQIGDFIGIIRRCHILGSVQNLNETDGCHIYVAPPHNHSFQICLCSEDYCNSAHLARQTTLVITCAYIFVISVLLS